MLYILILVISGLLSLFLPWWVVGPVCFGLCAWKQPSSKKAFSIAAAAITTLWVAYASFLEITATHSMAEQVGNLFAGFIPFLDKLPKSGYIITLIGLLGGLVGGTSGLAGQQFRKLLK